VLHICLLHPQDFTSDLISKFLNDRSLIKQGIEGKRKWDLMSQMYATVDSVNHGSTYFYGSTDVKLSFSRFISEYLLTLPAHVEILDELIDLHENREDTYGTSLLL